MKTTETKDTQNQTLQHTQTVASSSRFPLNSPEATGLRDLFYNGLQDIYWAEKQLTKAIPQMILQATSPDLVTALTDHLAVTHEQVARLEEIFKAIGENAQGKKCAAMEGLIKEGNEIIESTAQGVVRDAGIIAASQKVEHYEIATYGTLCAFAKILGEDEAAELLLLTLNEEKDADDKLSEVAETSVNMSAAGTDATKEPLSTVGGEPGKADINRNGEQNREE